jgi:hypothetical protein
MPPTVPHSTLILIFFLMIFVRLVTMPTSSALLKTYISHNIKNVNKATSLEVCLELCTEVGLE